MNRRSCWVSVALVAAGVVIALSVFFVVVGVPASEASAIEQCSVGPQCVESSTFRNIFVPTEAALIPLIAGIIAELGIIEKSYTAAWIGALLLLVFSLVAGFSIGLVFLPFALWLIGFLAMFPSAASVDIRRQEA
jgi:hypothetical protein